VSTTSEDGLLSDLHEPVSYPLSEDSARQVHDHLEILLSDPLFHHSKRLPGFLRYVVKEAIETGPDTQIKERTLGTVVFGRPLDYDTNADPVVRMTAGEVRKKLAQYYYAHPHTNLQIEVPLGSYMPRFRFASPAVTHAVEPTTASTLQTSPVESPVHSTEPVPEPTFVLSAWPRRLRIIAWAVAVAAVFAIVGGYVAWRQTPRETSVDRFWNSFASPSKPVLIVLPALSRVPQALPLYHFEAESVAIEDAEVAARLSNEFRMRNFGSHLVLATRVNLTDLRGNPFVLIGAMDNVWTMRLSQSLPFAFERSDDRRYGRIVDRKDPSKSWTEDFSIPNSEIPVDYGIIARFTDPTTEQPTVLIAGISAEGTLAAGEAVTTPKYLDMLLQAAGHPPGGFEAVIETRVIDGQSGPPQIVAMRTW